LSQRSNKNKKIRGIHTMNTKTILASTGAWSLLLYFGAMQGSTALAGQCAIDFEGLPAGTVITELAAGAGISGCNIKGSVAVTSQNCRFSAETAIVFDSTCTETPTSSCDFGDTDIGAPHSDWGGPGRGDGGCMTCAFPNGPEGLGNILVLAEDKDDFFSNATGAPGSDGLIDDPDDADCNGYVRFDFTKISPQGVTVDGIQVLDIEFDEGESPATITLTRNGAPPSTLEVVDTGDGGRVTIPFIGAENVTEMEVEFKGSGALAAVTFDAPKLVRACWATYGGFNNAFIGPEGSKVASFGGNVGPPPSGHLNVVHHELGQHLSVPDVGVVSCERIEANCPNSGGPGQPGGKKGFTVNTLNFAGTGTLDGAQVAVTGKLIDCGEPQGKKGVDPDQFWIYVDDGLFVGGPHDGGNVQLHPPVGKP
jgi:hypothetical protein